MNPARQAAQAYEKHRMQGGAPPMTEAAYFYLEAAIAAAYTPLLEKARLLAIAVEKMAPLYGFATMPAARQAAELLALLGEEK